MHINMCAWIVLAIKKETQKEVMTSNYHKQFNKEKEPCVIQSLSQFTQISYKTEINIDTSITKFIKATINHT